jgi:hemerythrin superfamily protein
MADLSKIAGSKDVVGFLKSQHAQIKTLFEQVIAETGSERLNSFAHLKRLMAAHEAAEEQVVHPTAKAAIAGGPAEVATRTKEEREAKRALSELAVLDVSSPEFETKIRVLQSAVLAHASSEEREEFDKLEKKLSESKLKDMRVEVERVEAAALQVNKRN